MSARRRNLSAETRRAMLQGPMDNLLKVPFGEESKEDFEREIDSDGDGVPDCLGAIPTVSTWGLVVMTLLLLIVWKLRFGRPLGSVA